MNIIKNQKWIALSALLAFLLTGCLFESENESNESNSVSQVEGLYFIGSDYESGALYTLDSTQKKAKKLLSVSQDSKVLTTSLGLVVLERTEADNILLYSLDSSKVIYQEGLGENANASDLVEYKKGFALMSLYNEGSVVKVDLSTGEIIDEIDLSNFAVDGSTTPNPNDLEIVDDLVYVSLQRLDEFWVPDSAYFLAIDPEKMSIVDTLKSAGKNPSQILNNKGELLVVFDGTTTFDAEWNETSGEDSYVASINLVTGKESVWIDEKTVGEKLKEILSTENKTYLVTSSGWGSATLNVFDKDSKKLSAIEGVSDASGGLAWYENKLWVGERAYGNEALIAFEQEKLAIEVSGDYLAPYNMVANP